MNKIKALVNNSAWVIAGIYLLCGFIWILFSDQWVLSALSDPDQITRVQSQKGWVFVTVSALVIFLLIRKSNRILGSVIEDQVSTNKKFEATFNHSPVGIAHHKPDEKWLEVNQTLCDLLGYSKEELMELSFSDFIDDKDLEPGRELDRKIASGETDSIEVEKTYIRSDGSRFPGLLRKSAVFNGHDSAVYLIAVVEDITRQKEHEEKLRKSLHQKDVLLAEVHHRVKNNLALISALLEFQTMYTESDQVHSVMDKNKIRIKCLAMIHETFSENGSDADINFSTFLKQLIEFMKTTFKFQNQKIIIKSRIQPVRLNINLAIPLSLIFTELIIHAKSDEIDFDTSPELSVSLSEGRNHVKLHVLDEKGMLFEKNDVDSPDTFTYTIVKTLVDQINGTFDARFEDQGTSFTITFKKTNVKGPGSHYLPVE